MLPDKYHFGNRSIDKTDLHDKQEEGSVFPFLIFLLFVV